MKKVAIFDIDGTIFRSSLLIELTEALIQEGAFSPRARKLYTRTHGSWLDRRGSYEDYINAVVRAFEKNIKGVRYDDFSRIARKVVALQKNHTYRYPRDLIKDLKKKNYYLLAISQSPQRIVQEFCRKMGFNKIYGRMHELDKRKRFTGKKLHSELIENKDEILKRAVRKENLTLQKSVGVGDTGSDIAFLKMVSEPICFNPNKTLYQHAKRAGWKIVVERKNVIYHL